jgi:hypothetical protein
MRRALCAALAFSAATLGGCASTGISVDPATIRAHQEFLASPALRGRGSATKDEAMAAAYVADRFAAYGLKPAPGRTSFLQAFPVPPSPITRRQGIPDDARSRNVVGFLPGSNPAAGYLLLSAHLDHLGVLGGQTFLGANDDASGTTALLELARLLASHGPHRRGILFVAFGAEEAGAVGSRFFAANPPVPLRHIVANIEFEMMGSADPKYPSKLMMSGFERSDLGALLRSHGAPIIPDPYPEQRFFERSDNYELALAGVVAHAVSGWVEVPTYHQVSDTNANIDFAYMRRAIQWLVEPIRRLANSDVRPRWNPGGRPVR